jgi:hypothetical protein
MIDDVLLFRHRMGNQDTEPNSGLKRVETTWTGRITEPRQRERCPKTTGESDHLIILRDGRADHMGKGVTVMRIRQRCQRQSVRDNVGLDQYRPTFLTELSIGYLVPAARVSMTEEPGAGKLHAGICAGGVG